MRATRSLVLALLFAAGLASACVVHPHPAHHHHRPRVVVIERGHVHSVRCGHYLHRGRWYHLRAHVHGARCGHVFVAGAWQLR